MHDDRWLLEGLLGLVAVASAISLTTFVRRPEYAAATGAEVAHGAGDYGERLRRRRAAPSPRARRVAARASSRRWASFIVHYPSYILFVAIANRMDLFLHAYVGLQRRLRGALAAGHRAQLGAARPGARRSRP